MAMARGGKSVKESLGFLIYGEQGTWKSSLCSEFIKFKNDDGSPFKVLYIDAEQGSIDSYLDNYEEEGYDLQNVYIVYTQSISEVNDFIEKAKNNDPFYVYDDNGEETDEVYKDSEGKPFKPDAIVVDGVSLLFMASQQSIIQFSKKRATVRANANSVVGMAKEVAIEGAGIELKDYNTLKFKGQDLIFNLLGSGKHFAVTCREEDEKEQYKDSKGEIKMMATGRKKPSGFKDVRYNVKTVLHTYVSDDGTVKAIVEQKDRTQVHTQNEVIENPTLLDWQKVVTRNKGKASYVTQNTLNASVDREFKAMEKENAKIDSAFEKEMINTNKPTTPEEWHGLIRQTISELPDIKKKEKQSKIVATGLNKAFRQITDMSELEKYYSIISG